ncbi:MAG: Crp/Fnr family transcriptional regulator [Oscillospiraceae bacterium]|nr:Crp/Fnr family transcriptional regulator [Oscillospiraceae bacterium]
MERYFEIIAKSPLFASIEESELRTMLHCLGARKQAFPKGGAVFLEGDPAGTIGMVLEGSVQVVRDDVFGDRSVLFCAEPGELFAETFSCAGVETMPVSAYAVRDSVLLLMDCRRMMTVCANTCGFHNRLIRNLLQVVAENNLLLTRKIRIMSKKTTREKLMAYLMEQAKLHRSRDFTIPLDRQALADYLGVERSAMSFELGKLRKAGVLETKGSAFRLLQS